MVTTRLRPSPLAARPCPVASPRPPRPPPAPRPRPVTRPTPLPTLPERPIFYFDLSNSCARTLQPPPPGVNPYARPWRPRPSRTTSSASTSPQQDVPADSLVAMGELAAAAGVTPGTATTMVKSLEERGLLDYTPRGGVPPHGPTARRWPARSCDATASSNSSSSKSSASTGARSTTRRRCSNTLSATSCWSASMRCWAVPHTDPHGDPIPPADGRRRPPAPNRPRPRGALADCPPNRPLRVCRVLDQTPDFLRFLRGRGLVPGATASVVTREPASDSTGRPRRRPRPRRPRHRRRDQGARGRADVTLRSPAPRPPRHSTTYAGDR